MAGISPGGTSGVVQCTVSGGRLIASAGMEGRWHTHEQVFSVPPSAPSDALEWLPMSEQTSAAQFSCFFPLRQSLSPHQTTDVARQSTTTADMSFRARIGVFSNILIGGYLSRPAPPRVPLFFRPEGLVEAVPVVPPYYPIHSAGAVLAEFDIHVVRAVDREIQIRHSAQVQHSRVE